jgi:hypothetical protein
MPLFVTPKNLIRTFRRAESMWGAGFDDEEHEENLLLDFATYGW